MERNAVGPKPGGQAAAAAHIGPELDAAAVLAQASSQLLAQAAHAAAGVVDAAVVAVAEDHAAVDHGR